MKRFPPWLIAIAAVGLGFFSFVIASGVVIRVLGSRSGHLAAMLFTLLVGLAAAYFTSKYSRRFMSRRLAKGDESGGETSQRQGRLAKSMFLSGLILFPVFIFAFLSSIINAYG